MPRTNARIDGFDGSSPALDRVVLAQHRCQRNGLCICGMDREACPVAREVHALLRRRYLRPPPFSAAHIRRVAAVPVTGPAWESESMAARLGAAHDVDQWRPR